MNILVFGGTRFFGIHLVAALLSQGHQVTIATRGQTADCFGTRVSRLAVDHTDFSAMKNLFQGRFYDVVYDNLVYSPNDVKYVLESVTCQRYIVTSTVSVYDLRPNTTEADFDPYSGSLSWGNRPDFSYGEGKQHAERALFQVYDRQNAVAVRFPFVVGPDDYTGRLRWYVQKIVSRQPMWVDNLNATFPLIRSDEAGLFLAHLAGAPFCGPINACNPGVISPEEVLHWTEEQTTLSAALPQRCACTL